MNECIQRALLGIALFKIMGFIYKAGSTSDFGFATEDLEAD